MSEQEWTDPTDEEREEVEQAALQAAWEEIGEVFTEEETPTQDKRHRIVRALSAIRRVEHEANQGRKGLWQTRFSLDDQEIVASALACHMMQCEPEECAAYSRAGSWLTEFAFVITALGKALDFTSLFRYDADLDGADMVSRALDAEDIADAESRSEET